MSFILPASPLRRPSFLSPKGQRGFTLLEVLVAIVVLSFGVLGVVGLQAAALQANKDARYQSTAVAMGRELADLMRGNKDLAVVDNAASNPYLIDVAYPATLTSASNCFTGVCTTAQAVAGHNIAEWLGRVQAALPGVRVVVCFDDTVSAALTWNCTNGTGLGTAVVKMGWTRQSYDRSESAPERATAPVVVLPLIPGSAT